MRRESWLLVCFWGSRWLAAIISKENQSREPVSLCSPILLDYSVTLTLLLPLLLTQVPPCYTAPIDSRPSARALGLDWQAIWDSGRVLLPRRNSVC